MMLLGDCIAEEVLWRWRSRGWSFRQMSFGGWPIERKMRDWPRSGCRSPLNGEQLAELARLVEEGPDIAVHPCGAVAVRAPVGAAAPSAG